MAKKVLVTGSAGFIGSNLAHYLVKEKPEWELFLLDALTYAGNLKNVASILENENVHFIKEDITNAEGINKIFEDHKFDMVFHLAAESHVDRSILNAGAFVMTNVLGTQNLISASRNTNVDRFVHVSTDEVYGALGPTGKFYETTPLDPTSPYSASKASSDLLVLANCKTHDFNAVVTRCTNNYGPYQFPEKLIPLFITNAYEGEQLPVYGDGLQSRHWIYVDDHNEALLAVAEKGKAGEVYNIGGPDDAEVTNIEVTKAILEGLGKDESLLKYVEDRLAHDRRYCVDIGKISTELGWKPKVGFKEGLEKTIKWYLDNQEWWKDVKSGDYMDYYKTQYGGN